MTLKHNRVHTEYKISTKSCVQIFGRYFIFEGGASEDGPPQREEAKRIRAEYGRCTGKFKDLYKRGDYYGN